MRVIEFVRDKGTKEERRLCLLACIACMERRMYVCKVERERERTKAPNPTQPNSTHSTTLLCTYRGTVPPVIHLTMHHSKNQFLPYFFTLSAILSQLFLSPRLSGLSHLGDMSPSLGTYGIIYLLSYLL